MERRGGEGVGVERWTAAEYRGGGLLAASWRRRCKDCSKAISSSSMAVDAGDAIPNTLTRGRVMDGDVEAEVDRAGELF